MKHLEEGSKANPIDVDSITKQIGTKVNPVNLVGEPPQKLEHFSPHKKLPTQPSTLELWKTVNGFENFQDGVKYSTLKKLYETIIGGKLPSTKKSVIQKNTILNDLINTNQDFSDIVIKFSKDNPGASKKNINDILEMYLDNVSQSRPQAESSSSVKQENDGLNDKQPGLYNFEVDKLMNRYKNRGFLGVYPIDELNKIMKPKNNHPSYSFILNNMPHNVKIGHFIAVKMEPRVLEYYDPLENKPKMEFMKSIASVLKRLGIKLPVQFKINKIRFQSSTSDNCGYFSMRFLQRRYSGENFKDASGFTRFMGIRDSERGIRKYRHKISEFGTLQKSGSIVDQFVVGMPVELHLRGTDDLTGENKKMSFCGPETKLKERLNPDNTWKP